MTQRAFLKAPNLANGSIHLVAANGKMSATSSTRKATKMGALMELIAFFLDKAIARMIMAKPRAEDLFLLNVPKASSLERR